MNRVCDQSFKVLNVECIALLSIKTNEQSCTTLRRAALRIRRNTRREDTVALLEKEGLCVVLLPETSFTGAQVVARRLLSLLIDLDMELQIVCGTSALVMLQHLYEHPATVIVSEEDVSTLPPGGTIDEPQQSSVDTSLPYLAFLSRYPPLRLFHLFPYELACLYHCVPVGVERGVLTLATSQRLHETILAQLRKATQRHFFLVRCEAALIDDLLDYWQRKLSF